MELVPVIYKFLLISGGLLLIILFGSYLISRLLKKNADDLISNQEKSENLSRPQTADEHLKNELLSRKTFNETANRNFTISETREIIADRKSKLESSSNGMRSVKDLNELKSKKRFSVVNKNSESGEKSQDKSEAENEFRIFYQQNYSNTA